MKENKRFYWIKLKTDFFNQEAIDFLLSQENGTEYIVLYQMLCLMTANNDGKMYSKIGEMIVPYKIEKIARDTKYFDSNTVTTALELFQKLGLIYEEENGIFKVTDFDKMVGSEAANANAQRQKRFREKQKQKQLTVTNSNVNSNDSSNVNSNDSNVTENNEEIRDRDKSIEYRDKSIDIFPNIVVEIGGVGEREGEYEREHKALQSNTKPTLAEVITYAKKFGVDDKEYCQKFFNHYESVGWIKSSGQEIKDWKSVFNNWLIEDKKTKASINPSWFNKEPCAEYYTPEEPNEIEELLRDYQTTNEKEKKERNL